MSKFPKKQREEGEKKKSRMGQGRWREREAKVIENSVFFFLDEKGELLLFNSLIQTAVLAKR